MVIEWDSMTVLMQSEREGEKEKSEFALRGEESIFFSYVYAKMNWFPM